MATMQELKTRYDSKNLSQIEKEASDAQALSTESRREFIEALFYLRHTQRYKEDKRWEKSDFQTYLRGKFLMTEHQFDNERRAYVLFGDASEKYGPGIVARAVRKCGLEGTQRVFTKIGDRVRSIASVEKVIAENARPLPDKIKLPAVTETQAQRAVSEARDTLIERDRTIKELYEQNKKLLKTVAARDRRIEVLEAENAKLREQLASQISGVYRIPNAPLPNGPSAVPV